MHSKAVFQLNKYNMRVFLLKNHFGDVYRSFHKVLSIHFRRYILVHTIPSSIPVVFTTVSTPGPRLSIKSGKKNVENDRDRDSRGPLTATNDYCSFRPQYLHRLSRDENAYAFRLVGTSFVCCHAVIVDIMSYEKKLSVFHV